MVILPIIVLISMCLETGEVVNVGNDKGHQMVWKF